MPSRRSFMAISGGSIAAAALSSVAFGQTPASSTPIVETSVGRIRGRMVGRIHAFKGVPYGASTAGAGRFLPPSKPQPWTGVRDAFELGLRCPQQQAQLVPEFGLMDRREPMGEDCLCLNVWTAGVGDGRKRPVMVWLHGGGFTGGSAGFDVYDGANLAAKHDVVLVGVNHRLNIFGFLYLADLGNDKYAQASNAGMLDIVAALQWVRDNIERFGGDSNNVTVFGQSGGGSKVSTLLGMPAAKGLFQKAIAQSGSQVTSVSKSDAAESALALLSRLGLKANQLDDLQKMPMEQLLALAAGNGAESLRVVPRPVEGRQAQAAPGDSRGGGRGGANPPNAPLRLSPVADGRTIPTNIFDPVATEISSNVPLMIGSTETEVTWNTQTYYDPLDDAALHARVRQTLQRADEAAVDRVIAIYRKNRPKAGNLDLYLILASDASNFRTGTDTEADRKAAQGKAPVYKYYFQWYSPVREGKLRSMHTMDIAFAFDNVDIARTEIGTGPERQPLADRMARAWVAFARTGNPSHLGLPAWPAYTIPQRATMVFNNDCLVVNNPYGEEKAALAGATPARATAG